MASGSRAVFLKRLHEMEKHQAQRNKGHFLSRMSFLSKSSSDTINDHDKSMVASGGYPNIGYDESSDDENYDEIVEENDVALNLDDDERESSRRKAEQWLKECEEADDDSQESSAPTPASARRSRERSDGLQTNGKKYLKTEPGLARKLNPSQPHGARKISWMNIFKRIQSKKVAYRLSSFLNNDAEMSFSSPKSHDVHHHHHDPFKKKQVIRRKKTKKLKNMTKEERRIYFKHRANARLRFKAQNMIGATGSRHLSQRRRASIATPAASPSMFSHLEQVNEEDENKPRLPPTRRRAVDTSDYRTCAILQTRLKTVRNYPE